MIREGMALEGSANIRAMRWRDSKESQNIQDYRGQSTGGGGGGGGFAKLGIGGIVALVAAWYFGIDPRLIMGLVSGDSAPPTEQQIQSGAPTDEAGQFVAHVLGDTEETWTSVFQQAGREYEKPTLVIFSQGINTGCGSATAAAGPFYCP